METESAVEHRIEPTVVRPFTDAVFQDMQRHVTEIRRLFDRPGNKYHDTAESAENRFNRWYCHNLPLIKGRHQSDELRALACEVFHQPVKPSYSFVAMYGPDGVCPVHRDRPQCQFTIDLLLSGGEEWPIYIDDRPYILLPGEAVCYSGSGQTHFRKPMNKEGRAKFANLAFFHWVPATWAGKLD
jgi:hypothetical protein